MPVNAFGVEFMISPSFHTRDTPSTVSHLSLNNGLFLLLQVFIAGNPVFDAFTLIYRTIPSAVYVVSGLRALNRVEFMVV